MGKNSFNPKAKNRMTPSHPKPEYPAKERWLFQNPKALKSGLKGLQESEERKSHALDIDFSIFKEEGNAKKQRRNVAKNF